MDAKHAKGAAVHRNNNIISSNGMQNGASHESGSESSPESRSSSAAAAHNNSFNRHSIITNPFPTKDHIDSIAGFSLPTSAGSTRVKLIFDFDQTVSAFDSCEWLVKYFKVFKSQIPPHIKKEYKDPAVPYEEFMNEVFSEFRKEGKDASDLLHHMRRLPIIDGYLHLFARTMKEHQTIFEQPIILSDSFVPIIKHSLLGNGVDADAANLRILAHSCQVLHDNNSNLSYFQAQGLMNQNFCEGCPSRLCKGVAMQQLFPFLNFAPSIGSTPWETAGKSKKPTTYNPSPLAPAELTNGPASHSNLVIMYSGDGKNDFCALKSLRACDIGMFKNNSPLAMLVATRAHELQCQVFGWENAFDILRILDEHVLGRSVGGNRHHHC